MDPRVAASVRAMTNRMAEPLRIRALAAEVGLSTSRFARIFRQSTGMPPQRFLQRVRVERARVLLENTTLSVREVMRVVGCRDANHFARDYRRHYGMTPRESRTRPSRSGSASRARTATVSLHGDSDANPSAVRKYRDEE